MCTQNIQKYRGVILQVIETSLRVQVSKVRTISVNENQGCGEFSRAEYRVLLIYGYMPMYELIFNFSLGMSRSDLQHQPFPYIDIGVLTICHSTIVPNS